MTTTQLSAQDLKSLVWTSPRPMVCKQLRIALIFSAKSGCTYAVKWFLHQMGHLAAAAHYDPWVHRYRERVFYHSHTYQEDAMHILDETTRVMRVVREPYARCVSSFVHAVRYGYEDESIGKFLRRKVDRDSGFSFREWLAYLETQDLRRCDVHHRLQAHELELENVIFPDRVLRLEDGRGEFRRLEADWGLEAADLESMRSSVHHTERASDAPFSGDLRLSLTPQDKKGLPPTRAFYDSQLREKVLGFYREDFDRYGYNPDAEV